MKINSWYQNSINILITTFIELSSKLPFPQLIIFNLPYFIIKILYLVLNFPQNNNYQITYGCLILFFFFQVARNCTGVIWCWHTCYIVPHSRSTFELFLSLMAVSAADFYFPRRVCLLVDRLVHRGERNKAEKVQAGVGWPGSEI